MPRTAKKCILCKMTLDDPVKLGEFKTYKNISAHYYCLLLTTQLLQNGSDHQGILGFLPQDIRNEEQRISSQICYYCNKKSANLACCAPKCRRVFHLYCGLENSAICHFKDDFRTICSKHHNAERKKCSKNDNCVICCESMGQYHRVYSILAPCCKSGWFHKWCIAKFALNAGYFFKCPLCNNRDSFRSKLVHKGIFVPDQDAAWELEPNAFADLLVRPDSCSAENCKCPRGRAYKSYPYTLNLCNTCGSNAIHQPCMESPSETYNCEGCTGILTNSLAEPVSNNASIANQDVENEDKNNNESDDEDIDIVSVEKSSKWADAEPDDNDSVDSLLIAFSRRKEGTEDGNGGSCEPSDMSGDSVLFDDKASSKSVVISNHPEDISDEDIDYIFQSVRKRKPDLQRMDSDDLPLSAKRSKSSSSSLDSVFFDEINGSYSESEEQFALRMTDSPVSSLEEVVPKRKRKLRKSVRSESDGKIEAANNEIETKPSKLRKVHSSESYTSGSFAGFESMPPLTVEDEVKSIEKVSPLSSTNDKTKVIRQRRMSEFMQRLPIVADDEEEEPQLTDNLYAVEHASIASDEDSDLPLSELISAKKSDPIEKTPPAKTPRQARLRGRAKSTCIERPRATKKRRRNSVGSRSKSVSSPAPLAIRRSSRLRDKPVEKIYKEDLIYVTDLKGDDVRRKAFKETEILHLFVKRDIKLRQEFSGAFKENYEANGGRRSIDPKGDYDRDYKPSQKNKINDVIIRGKSENSGVIIFSQPSAFQRPGITRRTISNYDSGSLKHTFFEF